MRKTLDITIEAEGRDRGKTFRLTEMPASRAERWAARAFMAMAKSGVELPDNIRDAGFAGIAAIGFRALGAISFEEARPLLDEMFECVMFVPDASRPGVVRHLVEDDIEEVQTRLSLRRDIFKLHTDFFTAGAKSTSTSDQTPAPDTRTTKMSRGRSR